ncbi:unnamed protein product [Moneuplotes crassus]|uniref:C2H2-type domain-containing protein n=1 Tax=Euplotes crassus TaxID=5936 RepID=A0AAD2D0F7_EUPCR|nr:unnamed protein product [Moneuplotes crassus]CAI2376400.1 unnamed protein product [Moneuplotes crassus]
MSLTMSGKPRQKRRSKHDQAGRDFKCHYCENAYLSYPAMYTHMKTKHYYNGSGGNPDMIMTTGRGRGRPRKNFGKVTKLNPESDDYFKTMEKCGGPTDPLTGFEDCLIHVLKQLNKEEVDFSRYPLYESLHKFSFERTPGNPEEEREKSAKLKDPALEIEYEKMGEEERNKLNCDDIFAVYLRQASQKVNESFYKLLLKFIIIYRECANKLGPKLADSDDIDKSSVKNETTESSDKFERSDKCEIDYSQIDFCTVNNAEKIPEMCNELITVFMEDHSFGIDRADAIDMTRNLCSWLYTNSLTCSKLSMAG